jgi:hypothetical protein
MRRILLAIRVFFRTLFDADVARQVAEILDKGKTAGAATGEPVPGRKAEQPRAPRPAAPSDALTLLATLQREARFVDFVKEPLESYSDAQIGAAAREVHRGCATVLERLFALRPVLCDEEGAEVEVPAGFDAGRYRLVGDVAGEPPFHGRMTHHGWEATTCELPTWSGTAATARVVAPVEVELR